VRFQITVQDGNDSFPCEIGFYGDMVTAGTCIRILTNSTTRSRFLKWAGVDTSNKNFVQVPLLKLIEFCLNPQFVQKGVKYLPRLRALGCALERQRLSGVIPDSVRILHIQVPTQRTDFFETLRFSNPEFFEYMAEPTRADVKESMKPKSNASNSAPKQNQNSSGHKRRRPIPAVSGAYEENEAIPQKRAKQELPCSSEEMWTEISPAWVEGMWMEFDGSLTAFFKEMTSINNESRDAKQAWQEKDQELRHKEAAFSVQKNAKRMRFLLPCKLVKMVCK
jgi:hypothetical protein